MGAQGEAVALLLAAGALGGLLAGLFGVGMGVTLVPAAVLAGPLLGVAPDVALRLGLGTALALTLPTSALAAWRQHARGALDVALFRRWAWPLLAGAVLGAAAVALVPAWVLARVFGVLALAVAGYLAFWPAGSVLVARPPGGALPVGLGCFSALMGVGGGTLGVPAMVLCGVPIGTAVATAAGFGVLVAGPAALGLMAAGWGVAGRPWGSLGWVSLPMLGLLLPVALATTPWGVRLAARLPARMLRLGFACFMALLGAKMLLVS
jgi:uncharacterized membrane protein YfcA